MCERARTTGKNCAKKRVSNSSGFPGNVPASSWDYGWKQAARENPDADGIILGSHGIFTWGETGKGCYQNTLRVLDAIGIYVVAAMEAKGNHAFGGQIRTNRDDRDGLAKTVMPALRGAAGGETGQIGHFSGDDDVMKFINSAWAKELAYQGTSCPDHFVRTKVRPLFVEWSAETGNAADLIASAKAAMEAYRADYIQYYETNKQADSPVLRSPNPTVILVPGVGMFSFGRNKAEARITGEFLYQCDSRDGRRNGTRRPGVRGFARATRTVSAKYTPNAQRPTSLHNYVALPLAESFGIEYWLLEEAKLKRMPPEKEMSRKIAVILGAGPGIGLAVAERFAREGAHIALADLNLETAQASAVALQKSFGKETAIAFSADATDRESLQKLYGEIALHFGGLDTLVMVAAVFIPPDAATGRNSDAQFKKTLEAEYLRGDGSGGRSTKDYCGAGDRGQYRADFERERSGREKRKLGLRHLEVGSQSSDARDGGRVRAENSGQRRRARFGRGGVTDVPA